MPEKKAIEHSGFVEEVNDKGVKVRFVSQSACSSCHAKGACSASEMEDKTITVPTGNVHFEAGESVRIIMAQEQGTRAVVIGYVFPLMVFVVMLMVLLSLGISELKSGLIALAFLLPYYLLLFIFKEKINQKFSFSIRKYE